MRWKPHVRFGRRPGETHPQKRGQGALGRSHLANAAVTKCRRRIQQTVLGHRGWKGDPLYGSRKLFLMGCERLDEAGWERLHQALRDGDPTGEVQDAWVANYPRDLPHQRTRRGRSRPRPGDRLVHRSGLEPRAPHARQDPHPLADRDPRPPHHRRLQRPRRSRQPHHQTGQAIRPRIRQHRQLPAPHLARRRLPEADSPRHATPSPTQVHRVGPVKPRHQVRGSAPRRLRCSRRGW